MCAAVVLPALQMATSNSAPGRGNRGRRGVLDRRVGMAAPDVCRPGEDGEASGPGDADAPRRPGMPPEPDAQVSAGFTVGLRADYPALRKRPAHGVGGRATQVWPRPW